MLADSGEALVAGADGAPPGWLVVERPDPAMPSVSDVVPEVSRGSSPFRTLTAARSARRSAPRSGARRREKVAPAYL